MYLRLKSLFDKSIGKSCTEKYVWLKTENTQESFLSDMIRNIEKLSGIYSALFDKKTPM